MNFIKFLLINHEIVGKVSCSKSARNFLNAQICQKKDVIFNFFNYLEHDKELENLKNKVKLVA